MLYHETAHILIERNPVISVYLLPAPYLSSKPLRSPTLNSPDYCLPYPCLFSETCVTIPPMRQIGYKKRNLLGVKLGAVVS